MLDLVRCEFTKLKRRKITLMLIVLSCFFPLIVVMTTKNGMSGDLSTHYLKMRFDLSFTMTQGYGLVFLAPCLIGMLATILFFMERDNDTFKNIKTVPVTITKMILAKICVLFIYGTLFSLTSVSFTIFFSWILKVGIIYDLAYKLGFSIIFGLVITIASLPIVVIIVYFNKSYLVSTLLAFFYSILNWGIIGLFETMAVKGTAKFLNLFPVICAMDWTTALLQQAIKDISLAKNKLIEDGLHAGFCLCHGNMGNLLILKRYAEIFDDKQVRSICDSRFEQILEFLNEENILPTELYNPGFMTGLSGIAYALLKYKMPKLPLLIGVEGIYDRNEV